MKEIEQQGQGIDIILPHDGDPKLREFLSNKIKEYKDRVERYTGIDEEKLLDAQYKLLVAQTVYDAGTANSFEIIEKIIRSNIVFNDEMFTGAFHVIKKYIEDGGKGVSHGAGFGEDVED